LRGTVSLGKDGGRFVRGVFVDECMHTVFY
jgi:hypothetical protein